jgi:hypothetical protein
VCACNGARPLYLDPNMFVLGLCRLGLEIILIFFLPRGLFVLW